MNTDGPTHKRMRKATQPQRPRKRSNNVFGIALKQAQKQLSSKLQERMQAETTVSRLNYEIPHLEKMIRALEAQLGHTPGRPAANLTSFEVSPEMGSVFGGITGSTPESELDLESALPETAKGGDWK